MKSRWFQLKNKAIRLRRCGLSIRNIENSLKIPRSTLSGWLHTIILTEKQKDKLIKDHRMALIKAREKAVRWHKRGKIKRIKQAKQEAMQTIEALDVDNQKIQELALAMLYLGEGSKTGDELAIGNSDPKILKFFLGLLKHLYKIDVEKIRCQLNLRADQDKEKMKRFWSRKLALPIRSFKFVSLDMRTKGSPTYSYYKGVCQIRCGMIQIQRKLLFLSDIFCKGIIEKFSGS